MSSSDPGLAAGHPPNPRAASLVGRLVADRYWVDEYLGEGGTARSYLATDTLFGGQVALKVLERRELSSTLRHEFTVLRGLVHPNVNTPRAFGVDSRTQPATEYLVADFVPGVTFAEFAAGKSWGDLRRVLLDILRGLGFLHARGLGHGDIKPSNVMVDAQGRGILIDFGCARRLGTRSDAFYGTWAFAAPELKAGERFDARADLYALGKTLEQVLSAAVSTPSAREHELLSSLTSPLVSRRPAEVSQLLLALDEPALLDAGACGHAPGFLGREAELTRLQRVLDDHREARQGVRWIHVWGPAGIGASRLVEELAFRAQRHLPVLETATWRHDGVVDLTARVTGSSPASHLEQALTQWRRRAADDTPLVAVIDDVHRMPIEQQPLLLALARTCESNDSVLCLSSGHEPLNVTNSALLDLELGPLDSEHVAEWRAATGTELSVAQLYARTSGFPGAIRQALAHDAHAVDAHAADKHDANVHGVDVSQLSEAERYALSLLVVGAADVSEVELATWASLNSRGWVTRRAGSYTLLHSVQRAALRSQLPQSDLERAHACSAQQLRKAYDGSPDADAASLKRMRAQLACHELGSGRLSEAAALSSDAEPSLAWLPLADELLSWLDVRTEACSNSDDERRQLAELAQFAARTLLHVGQQANSRRLLGRVFGIVPTSERGRLLELAAEELLRSGKAQRARRLAGHVLDCFEGGRNSTAAPLTLLARAHLQLGETERAADYCSAALRQPMTEPQRAELQQVQAMAWMYQGSTREAVEVLRPLAEEFRRLGQLRQQSRCLSYLAITHFRRGELELARSCYDEAFAAAESNGDADLIAGALLNRATLEQQLGHWGAALRGYERALVLARALGRRSTVITLRFNLGNLALQIGAFDHAERMLQSVVHDAQQANSGPVLCSAHLALAELAIFGSRAQLARSHVEQALEQARTLGANREILEAQLLAALVELTAGNVAKAAETLEGVHSDDEPQSDLQSITAAVLSRCRLAADEPARAVEAARAALDHAQRAAHLGLEAKAHTLLSQALTVQHDPSAALHREQGWRIYNRMAAELPESYREMFWEHPDRLPLLARSRIGAAEPTVQRDRLQQFLAVNRRINSTLSVDQVLAAALDAAIELTGAERGFVLMAGEDEALRPRATRNISQLKLEDESMSFSRSIAERVLRSERAVVTVDASSDSRFALQVSVHAMQLKSVACVPFASAAGLRGVLYVDNRVQLGRFSEDDTQLLVALGDQVAIALDNAQLHAELLQRSEELDRARRAAEKSVAQQRRLINNLERTLQTQQLTLNNRFAYEQIVGRGPAMQRVLSVLDRVIETDVTVLVEGESGTGKELFARAIHNNSKRREGPFVSINCGALPEALLESELFGHQKGAFSGASEDRLGLLQAANAGTVFLDEIGDMPLALQVKLLRALQERSIRPLGATKEEPIDIRIVAATHRRLSDEVAKGTFREDLFFRLSVVQVEVPPLRERAEDVPELCAVLLRRIADSTHTPPPVLSKAALKRVLAYNWPGNVRQLENTLTKATLLCDGTILPDHLELENSPSPKVTARSRGQFEQHEAERIFAALRTHRWNVSAVSRALDMPRNTLYRKMKRYKLERET